MEHLLLGYGYVAKHLALALSQKQLPTLAMSRSSCELSIPHFRHHAILDEDLNLELPKDYILYYFIPPQEHHDNDKVLEHYLKKLIPLPQKIIYIGSSGIYGDHQGHMVDEESKLHIHSPRQKARLSAENQFLDFAQKHHIPLALLRVAGIYGPNRLPIEAASKQEPLIYPEQAPLINHIYVKDLVKILMELGQTSTYHGILNICDGNPQPMGSIQSKIALHLHFPPSTYLSFSEVFAKASSMKKEFMTQNKQLSHQRLSQVLTGTGIVLHDLDSGIKDCLENLNNFA